MTHVAHHFDDAQQQFDAANLGMWVFLVTEVMFFGGLFAGYTAYRFAYTDAFVAGSGLLDMTLGAVNTAVLLTSSLMMALAVHAAQTGNARRTVQFLLLTIVLGMGFLGVKAYEYAEKFRHHEVPGPNFVYEPSAAGHAAAVADDTESAPIDAGQVELFFGFYFALTGLHALHMVIGVGLLAVIAVMAGRGQFTPEYYTPVEIVGLYWHFVDIVWVFLFPLLYLIG